MQTKEIEWGRLADPEYMNEILGAIVVERNGKFYTYDKGVYKHLILENNKI